MNFYLKKYGYTNPLIKDSPSKNLQIVVVIPCFNETNLIESLESLKNCKHPDCDVEVIIIINCAEDASINIIEQNLNTFQKIKDWIKKISTNSMRFYCFNISLPVKDAGVGLARKIGMDEAVRRFDYLQNHDKGIILCFDADCICDTNYFISIATHFQKNSNTPGAAIYFEHPLEGKLDFKIYKGIIQYELFLRYYVNALKFAGHPFAFQTIGSSMAVRSSIYQAQGGMNKKKAGEDFYFLQKVIALGNFTEINTTRVIPSPRPSDRVPFGTGKAISNWLIREEFLFYDFSIFKELKIFIESLNEFYEEKNFNKISPVLPLSIQDFLEKKEFEKILTELRTNTTSYENFTKRFFKWFNGFQVLKFVHFATQVYYPKISSQEALKELFKENRLAFNPHFTEKDFLIKLRNTDRRLRQYPLQIVT